MITWYAGNFGIIAVKYYYINIIINKDIINNDLDEVVFF